MTKQEFLELDITKVSQVYYGKDNVCRCGCAGDYYSTSYHKGPRAVVNNQKAKELLEMAQKRAIRSKSTEYEDIYVNVPFGKKAITVYFDEV